MRVDAANHKLDVENRRQNSLIESMENMREADERTRIMLDSTPLCCTMFNKEHKCFDCNQESVNLFELHDKRECIGRFYELSPEFQPCGMLSGDKFGKQIDLAFREGYNRFDWMHRKLNGEQIPCEVILVRVNYKGEDCVVGYSRDLREYNAMLDEIHKVESDLCLARNTAEKSNRAKSEFIANISHEMRTPMNAVIGFSEMILDKSACGSKCGSEIYVRKIYKAGLTLLNIINDILDISKIESGKYEILPAIYDLPDLICDTVALNITRIEDKPVEFILDIDERLPSKLWGDDLRIKQICNNLLSNAFKYTKEGAVVWSVSCVRDAGGDCVRLNISVKDTGIGIREEDAPKLFTDFGQLDTKSNRQIEGTGLGLTLTRKMVNMMGGSITVESEYGKGSVFSVSIPQKHVTDMTIGAKAAEELRSFRYGDDKRLRSFNLIRTQLPYAKVLIVDDSYTNLEVAKGLMKPYGMQVDCVSGGAEAVEAIRAGKVRYSAVFMDHMMPDMDGIEATRIIREEIGTVYAMNIPIIMLTANAVAGNEKMFLSKGFQAFLSKPIDIMRLDSVIRHWVKDSNSSESNARRQASVNPGDGGETPVSKTNIPVREPASREWHIEGLDLAAALSQFGDIEVFLDILRVFASETPALLNRIRDAGSGDLKNYMVTVHGIKGSCRGITAESFAVQAEKLEYAAKAGDYVYVREHNHTFIADVEKFLDILKKGLGNNGRTVCAS